MDAFARGSRPSEEKQPPHSVQRRILFFSTSPPPAAWCHRADSAVPVYHITSNHSPPPPHRAHCLPPPPRSLALSEDHKWLHARSHLFDSPTGAFMSPFILSPGWLADWLAAPPATIVFSAALRPAAARRQTSQPLLLQLFVRGRQLL